MTCRYNSRGEQVSEESSKPSITRHATSPVSTATDASLPSIRRLTGEAPCAAKSSHVAAAAEALDKLREDALAAAARELGLDSLPMPLALATDMSAPIQAQHSNTISRHGAEPQMRISGVDKVNAKHGDDNVMDGVLSGVPGLAETLVAESKAGSEESKATSQESRLPFPSSSAGAGLKSWRKKGGQAIKLTRKQMDSNWDALR